MLATDVAARALKNLTFLLKVTFSTFLLQKNKENLSIGAKQLTNKKQKQLKIRKPDKYIEIRKTINKQKETDSKEKRSKVFVSE